MMFCVIEESGSWTRREIIGYSLALIPATLLPALMHVAGRVYLIAAIVAGWGFYAFRNLTVEAFPDPTDTQVNVITLFPGQPTEEVERRVSIPLERALNGTPGLFRLRSISLFGLSSVTLTFNEGVDPLIARQQVLERSSQAELPEGVQPSLGPLATPIGEVYRYTIESVGDSASKGESADTGVSRKAGTDAVLSAMELKTLHEWQIKNQL